MRTVASGRIGRVFFVRLAPGDDLYSAIIETIRAEGIRSGVVLDMTGAATNLRLSLPAAETDGHQPPQILDVPGLAEVLGSGIIGQVVDEFVSGDGEVHYRPGDPYAHIHVSATVAGRTYTGHLVEGTLVRSVIEKSHFTIALAEVEGVELTLRVEDAGNPHYPAGVPYHELTQL